MSAGSNAERLFVVPGPEGFYTPGHYAASKVAGPSVCPLCHDTEMEIVPGKGTRRCQCRGQDRQGKLFEEAQNSYNPISQTSELKVLTLVLEGDVLVSDELGSSKPTDLVGDALMQIIGARHNERKLTIYTINYGDERR